MIQTTTFPQCCAVEIFHHFYSLVIPNTYRRNVVAIFAEWQYDYYMNMCKKFKLKAVVPIKSNDGARTLALCVFERKK